MDTYVVQRKLKDSLLLKVSFLSNAGQSNNESRLQFSVFLPAPYRLEMLTKLSIRHRSSHLTPVLPVALQSL